MKRKARRIYGLIIALIGCWGVTANVIGNHGRVGIYSDMVAFICGTFLVISSN